MKGCYVYCTDAALAAYLRGRLNARGEPKPVAPPQEARRPATETTTTNVLPLRRVSREERAAGMPAAPLVDLRFAAGAFSDFQALEQDDAEWVALPDWVRPQLGLFVAQVIGESMNRRIPNGSWCLFRLNPTGTREGKVVVAQHRSIEDPELGGRYTVKVYSSRKVAAQNGECRHREVTLAPDSDRPGYEPIRLLDSGDTNQLSIIAELLLVLSPG